MLHLEDSRSQRHCQVYLSCAIWSSVLQDKVPRAFLPCTYFPGGFIKQAKSTRLSQPHFNIEAIFPGQGILVIEIRQGKLCLNNGDTYICKTKSLYWNMPQAGPLFTKQKDVFPWDLVKSLSQEIECYNDCIALKIYSHLGSTAAEAPVKIQSDWKSLNLNLVALMLHEILG